METIYNTILSYIRTTPTKERYFLIFCKYIPYLTVVGYLITILYLLLSKDSRITSTLLRPIIVFLIVTIFRKLINRPRPYESLHIQPLFKHKKGESFPSRHTASAFIIAFTCFSINSIVGSFLLCVASLVALTRIVAGVHYPSDVLIAIIMAYLGYIL